MDYHKLGCSARAVLWITSCISHFTKQAKNSYVWCGMVAEEEESQTVPLHFRSSWTSKTPETWAEPNATLVMFLSGLFSPIQHVLLLFSFPHCPLCLPHPLCLLALKIFESWPFPPPPFLLLSLPYHCSPLQLLSPELPHQVLHPGIFIQRLHLSAPALCWLFTLFFSFTVPLQREESTVRAGGSLPALGPGVTGASQMRNFQNMPRAQPCQVPLDTLCCHMCCLHRQAEALTNPHCRGIFEEHYNRLDVQESTRFWRCQTWVYFPGDSKGHTFQVLSSKHGGTAGHKKKQLEKFTLDG